VSFILKTAGRKSHTCLQVESEKIVVVVTPVYILLEMVSSLLTYRVFLVLLVLLALLVVLVIG